MNTIIFKELVIALGKLILQIIGVCIIIAGIYVYFIMGNPYEKITGDTTQQPPTRAIRQGSFDGKTWYTIDTITLKP